MARQHINLATEEEISKRKILHEIQTGQMTKEEFENLPPEKKQEVNSVLFDLSAAGINLYQGASALEFILFTFMRITNKRVAGMSLSEDEKEMEVALQHILALHEITNPTIRKEEWLFDYLSYAEKKSAEFLQNRQEHVERKKQTTGKV